MDLRSPNRFGPIFVEAAHQAGYPLNDDFNGPVQEGVGRYQVTHKNGERFSAAKAYLTPNRGRKNLTVMTGAHTTRILFEGRRAIGVELRVNGTLQQLKAMPWIVRAAPASDRPKRSFSAGALTTWTTST